MISDTTRRKLIESCQLIFVGIPVGKNSFKDTPIIGNLSLAQVVVNRVNSVTKNPDEFKFMVDTIVAMLKDTKGKDVHKIKLDETTKSIVNAGFSDEKGFIIKK